VVAYYLKTVSAFKRMDTSTVPVDKHSYEELILQGRNVSFEELICESQKLEFSVLEKNLKRSLKIGKLSTDILITLSLISNGKYNNAAGLLSDNNPLINSNMHLLAFATDSVKEIKDRLSLSGISILEQFERSLDFYRKHINSSEIIDAPYRQTIEEVPLVAYREAVANAIVHRDYSRAGDIRIEVYNDRIEVTSPGGLPRNRILTEIFFRLRIIEKLATGIRRIKEHYQEFQVTPIFSVSENSIQIILPKVNMTTDTRKRGDDYRISSLNDKEKIIYNYIKSKGTITRKEAEDLLGLKKTQTAQVLKRLYELNVIMQIGSGRSTRYKIRSL